MQENDDMQLPFNFRKRTVSAGQQQKNWNAIEGHINVPVARKKKWNTAILSFVILLVIAGIVFLNNNTPGEINNYKTGYAQTKRLTLPDGSKVILNANSTLRITANWTNDSEREVWLEGEAFFEVEKKPSTGQKFIVHARDVDVEVLGTRFNVNTRHQKSTVSLEEGKVKLSAKGELQTILQRNKQVAVIEMKPGEIARAGDSIGIKVLNAPEVENNSGWIRNEWHFDNTTLREIAVMIEDLYGYKTEMTDEKLLDFLVSGDLRAANINELLAVLEFTHGLKMKIEKRTIKISQP